MVKAEDQLAVLMLSAVFWEPYWALCWSPSHGPHPGKRSLSPFSHNPLPGTQGHFEGGGHSGEQNGPL